LCMGITTFSCHPYTHQCYVDVNGKYDDLSDCLASCP
jgi:hypothetical protein